MTLIFRTPYSLKEHAGTAPLVAAIGKFDGFHKGHQKILEDLKSAKRLEGRKSVLISFYPSPAQVLNPDQVFPYTTSIRQRLAILKQYEADYYLLLRFNQSLLERSADSFVNDFLISELDIEHLLLGQDACVGHKREGDAKFIRKNFEEAKRKAETVDFERYLDCKISSGWLRSTIASGDFMTYRKLCNRNYCLDSVVVKGDGRGHDLGFPTANLKNLGQMLPLTGIYATLAHIEGEIYPSVSSIGYRPTFQGKEKVAEVHIIGEQDIDLYNKRLELEFIQLLRTEVKYESTKDLIRQVKVDIQNSEEVLRREAG